MYDLAGTLYDYSNNDYSEKILSMQNSKMRYRNLQASKNYHSNISLSSHCKSDNYSLYTKYDFFIPEKSFKAIKTAYYKYRDMYYTLKCRSNDIFNKSLTVKYIHSNNHKYAKTLRDD